MYLLWLLLLLCQLQLQLWNSQCFLLIVWLPSVPFLLVQGLADYSKTVHQTADPIFKLQHFLFVVWIPPSLQQDCLVITSFKLSFLLFLRVLLVSSSNNRIITDSHFLMYFSKFRELSINSRTLTLYEHLSDVTSTMYTLITHLIHNQKLTKIALTSGSSCHGDMIYYYAA